LPVALKPMHLLAVPLRLLKASEDHFDDLFRELQMATLPSTGPPEGPEGTAEPLVAPAAGGLGQLAGLGEEVKRRLRNFREPARRAVGEATKSGASLVDFDVVVDPPLLAAFGTCERLLLGAARAARAGHLLTEPAAREVGAWRKWVTDELAGQMEGRSPRVCPFPAVTGRPLPSS